MHEIEYRIASEKDIDLLMSSRLEMLRVVNGLDADYQFSEDFIHDSRVFFQKGDQTTVLALAEKMSSVARQFVIFGSCRHFPIRPENERI